MQCTMYGMKRLLAALIYAALIGYVIYITYYKEEDAEEIIRGHKLIKDVKTADSAAQDDKSNNVQPDKPPTTTSTTLKPVIAMEGIVHSFIRQRERSFNQTRDLVVNRYGSKNETLISDIVSKDGSKDGSSTDANTFLGRNANEIPPMAEGIPFQMIFHRFPHYEDKKMPEVPLIAFNSNKDSLSAGSDNSLKNSSHSSVINIWNFPDKQGQRYVVIGCNLPRSVAEVNYPFYLFMNIHAWQRIGYETILFLVGSESDWSKTALFNFTLSQLKSTGTIIAFIDGFPQNHVMLSQVSRLFASVILPWTKEDTVIITTDADIWPLDKAFYDIPAGKLILSTNSECCGHFNHNGRLYKLLPMCYIEMSVRIWRDVMQFPSQQLTNPEDIMNYAKSFYGDLAYRTVEKGENDGWYLDQHIASIQIQKWADHNGMGKIAYVSRDPGRDRIDKTMWLPWKLIDKQDAHLLDFAYRPGIWERLKPLIALMFSQDLCALFDQYRDKFLSIYFTALDNGG